VVTDFFAGFNDLFVEFFDPRVILVCYTTFFGEVDYYIFEGSNFALDCIVEFDDHIFGDGGFSFLFSGEDFLDCFEVELFSFDSVTSPWSSILRSISTLPASFGFDRRARS